MNECRRMLKDKHQVMVKPEENMSELVVGNQRTRGTGTEIMEGTWIIRVKMVYEMTPQEF